jgi:hypothetical protein
MKKAKSSIKQKIEASISHKSLSALGYYNGSVDITEAINFGYIAESYGLTVNQYVKLIDYGQNLAEKAINKIL